MRKKELEAENRKLIRQNKGLLIEKKELLRKLGLTMIKLSEEKRINSVEIDRLYNRVKNPVIYLPSGRLLKLKELNDSQLNYLESLIDKDTNIL